jgi:beta-lactamase regulating signal transducer with metallopeptidase domain
MNSENVLLFLADWALRGMILALIAAVLMKIFRVNDSSTRLGGWVAVLCATLLMPFAMQLVPGISVLPASHLESAARVDVPVVTLISMRSAAAWPSAPRTIDWAVVALCFYGALALFFLIRLLTGLILSRRLIRRSIETEYADVRESVLVPVPVTVGTFRSVILLPEDWRSWDDARLQSVLEHERSHVRRCDPLIQTLSAIHRSLLWFSPLTWWLHARIADLAEDASDDRALSISTDAETYAETLLAFVRRTRRVRWSGVAMARTAGAERRIDRILSGHTPSRGLGKEALLAIVLLAVFMTCVTAAMQVAPPPAPPIPARAPTPPPAAPERPSALGTPIAPFAPIAPAAPGTVDLGDHSVSISKGHDGKTVIRFSRDGEEYVITDRDTVERAQKLFGAQSELGQKQSELGLSQSRLGELQSELGNRMSSLRTELPDLSRQISQIAAQIQKQKFPTAEELSRIQNQLSELQEQFAAQQEKLGEKQSALGEQMEELGRQQSRIGDQQSALGSKQEELAEKAARELEKLIDSAIQMKLAKPVL